MSKVQPGEKVIGIDLGTTNSAAAIFESVSFKDTTESIAMKITLVLMRTADVDALV